MDTLSNSSSLLGALGGATLFAWQGSRQRRQARHVRLLKDCLRRVAAHEGRGPRAHREPGGRAARRLRKVDRGRQVVQLGPLPVRVSLAGQYMVVSPDEFGQQWNVQVVVSPVLPTLVRGQLAHPASLEFGLPDRR